MQNMRLALGAKLGPSIDHERPNLTPNAKCTVMIRASFMHEVVIK